MSVQLDYSVALNYKARVKYYRKYFLISYYLMLMNSLIKRLL